MTNYFVTGANRGIGLSFVQHILRRADAKIVATARSLSSATELSELQRANPDRLALVELDVTNESQIAQAVEATKSKLGFINYLINNAGILNAKEKSISEVSAASLMEHFAVNAIAPTLVAQAFLPLLQAAPEGQPRVIGNISTRMASIADNTSGGYYAYRSSKTAFNSLSKCMAVEFAAHGVIVLPMHPGWVQTRMGGPDALIDTEKSVSGLLTLIENAKKEQSGRFWNWSGEELPW